MKKFLGCVLVIALIAVAVTACAPKAPTTGPAAPGAPEVINWVVMGDYSGPYAASVGPIRIGALHATEYVNAQGGIAGVKVNPLLYDCGGKVDIAVSQFAESMTKQPKPLFVSYYYSSLGEALHDRFVENKIPTLGSASLTAIYPRATVFAQYPMYADMFGAFCDWVVKQSKEPVKLGIITADTTYGKQILLPEAIEYAKSKGITIVGEEKFGPRDVDMTTQLVRLRSAGANWLASNYTGMPMIAILKNLKELGWKVPFFTGYSEMGQFVMDPALVVGTYFVRERGPLGSPEVKFILDVAKSKGTPLEESIAFYTLAWVDLYHGKAVIEKIVKEKGWAGVNADSILAGFMKSPGPLLNGYCYRSYTRDRYHPDKCRIFKWVATTKEEVRETEGFVPASDWLTCPDIFKDNPLRKEPPMYSIP